MMEIKGPYLATEQWLNRNTGEMSLKKCGEMAEEGLIPSAQCFWAPCILNGSFSSLLTSRHDSK